jgi:hypothetical protein
LPSDPDQGWKLHVAATILTADCVLRRVAPMLRKYGVLYKAPISLTELERLNQGITYGYSQIGKFLTIYPQTGDEAALLAKKIHRLTRSLSAPAVPFDWKYRPKGCVSYRYGAFRAVNMEGCPDEHSTTIRDPEGNIFRDLRNALYKPDWVSDPFAARGTTEPAAGTPLQTTFKVFRALAQRGRGGVYQAVDLSVAPPRLCILKEGRKDGEVNWDGRDGFWRIKHESRVLALLRKKGVNVPRVYSSFRANKNFFLAVEFIEGEDIGSWLARKQRRISITTALKRGAELARIVSRIHAAGWVWRDCKPSNIVIANDGELRPLDFEGACPINRPDRFPWGTPAYIPSETTNGFRGQSRLPEDLYALGAVMYFLLTGRTPDISRPLLLTRLRKKIPHGAQEVVMELLASNPQQRPQAQAVALRIEEMMKLT